MKKLIALLLILILSITLFACGKPENRADTSLRSGETKITGRVERVSGNIILLSDGNGGKYTFSYSDEITVVENGWYVVDLAADSFREKRISVICSEQIMETYPAMLTDVRMVITE